MPISLRVQRMKGKQSLSGCWPFLSDLWPHFVVVVVVAYLLFFLMLRYLFLRWWC